LPDVEAGCEDCGASARVIYSRVKVARDLARFDELREACEEPLEDILTGNCTGFDGDVLDIL
jgi:hypothetical protein